MNCRFVSVSAFFLLFFFINFSPDSNDNSHKYSIIPHAYAANANLFVSAENSQFSNFMSGPQVIEVVVIDSDINDVSLAEGEPDVTVNGKTLRMVQAVDGNWYGYFADRKMAQIADSTSVPNSQEGLDFGLFCSGASASAQLGVSLSDTDGVAIPMVGGAGAEGQTNGGTIIATCSGAGVATSSSATAYDGLNVVREAKDVNLGGALLDGQIGINAPFWPFVQLYSLNPAGSVVIKYNKGGGAQTTTLTFDTVDQFAKVQLDRITYPRGSQVHATITDLWLNIDPTDEDSWTFGTTGSGSSALATTHYQVFDKDGMAVGDTLGNTSNLLTTSLGNLMCQDNCKLITDFDVQNQGPVFTLQDNKDQGISLFGLDPQSPTSWGTGNGNLVGNVPITITEQGPNSGVFGTYDETEISSILITTNAKRGTSASIDYKNTGTILVGFFFGSVNISLQDSEWNSGEQIPLTIEDGDANRNSRADEDLNLNDPNASLIPSLKTGSPATLEDLTNAGIAFTGIGSLTVDTVQAFSDRAILRSTGINAAAGDTLTFTVGSSTEFTNAAPLNAGSFRGVALLNYDLRSFANEGNFASQTVSVTVNGVAVGTGADPLQALLVISDATKSPSTFPTEGPLTVAFTFNTGGTIPVNTLLPVAVDVFGFGFTDDGVKSQQRIANQIIRIEAKETGDNTGKFEGSLEYTMLNQLNILDLGTFTGLSTIADDPSFIAIEDLTDEDAPRVNYLDLGADGVSTQVSDQEDVHTHSGVVSYQINSGITHVELEDLDLSKENDTIDVLMVVDLPDPNFGVVGAKSIQNGGTSIELSNGSQLGRILDVTFDDIEWKTPTPGPCKQLLEQIVGTNTGLDKSGFSLVETTPSSGVFAGDFEIPSHFCRTGSLAPDSTSGLEMKVNYFDFRDGSGEFKILDPSDKFELKLDSGSFEYLKGFYKNEILQTSLGTADNFFFLQTKNYLSPSQLAILATQGIEIIGFHNGFVYVAKATDQSLDDFPFSQHPEIRSMVPIEIHTKIESSIKNKIDQVVNTSASGSMDIFTVLFHQSIPQSDMNQIISPFGDPGKPVTSLGAIKTRLPYSQIENLAKNNFVKFITKPEPPLENEISESREIMGIDELNGESYGLTGRGSVALVFEESNITPIPEFIEHFQNLETQLVGGCTILNQPDPEQKKHANHVAGIIAANNSDDTKDGIAPDTVILSYGSSFSIGFSTGCADTDIWYDSAGDLEDAWKEANEKISTFSLDRIDFVNISLGHAINDGTQPCSQLGDYSLTSQLSDKIVRGLDGFPPVSITQAAGNERRPNSDPNDPYTCQLDGPGYPNMFGTINSPATAKNPIVVGAIYSESVTDTEWRNLKHSGFGPTDDGRIKPDLVAFGSHNLSREILSTGIDSQNGETQYIQMKGTSMSAPMVGGIVSLMEEQWENQGDRFNRFLMPHTAKAILVHTADDIGNPGPDYKFGWGKVNPKKAVDLIRDSSIVDLRTSNQVNISDFKDDIIIYDSISGPNNTQEYTLKFQGGLDLKATLVWDDLPSDPVDNNQEKALINDLDLRVENDLHELIRPKSPSKIDHDLRAFPQDDNVNNVEMINEFFEGSELKIKVSKKQGFSDNLQDFTLIISALKKEINPSPIALEDLRAEIHVENKNAGDQMAIHLTITDDKGENVEHLNYRLIANQGSTNLLNEIGDMHSGSTNTHYTIALPQSASDSNPVIISVESIGMGHDNEFRSLEGEITNSSVVPEFGAISLMVLIFAIILGIIISSKPMKNLGYKV